MAITASDLDFNIEFNFQNDTSKFVITDNTSYPADGTDYYWLLKIASPSGVLYTSPNYNTTFVYTPDTPAAVTEGGEGQSFDSSVAAPAGRLAKTAFTIPTDGDGNYETGTYTISIAVNADDGVNTLDLVGVKSYTLDYTSDTISAPTVTVNLTTDLITATATATDNSSYTRNSITPTVTRDFNLYYPTPSGLITKNANTTSISVAYPNVYTGNYTAELTTTATYDISSNYTVVYEVVGTDQSSLSTSATQSKAYEGLKNYLNRVETKTTAGDLAGAAEDLETAEEIEVYIEAYYTALATGNSSDAQDWINKAVSVANLTDSSESEGTVQITPVNQGFAGTNSLTVQGNATYGTEVTTATSGSGTVSTVKLTETFKNKVNNSITDSDVVYTQARFRTEGIAESRGTTTATLVAGGGTISLNPSTGSRFFKYSGSATLSSNYTIQIDPTLTTSDLVDGDWVIVDYDATMTLSGNTITIFGLSLTEAQALGGNVMIINIYDEESDSWSAKMITGESNSALYDSSGNKIIDVSDGYADLLAASAATSSTTALVLESNQIKTSTSLLPNTLADNSIFLGNGSGVASASAFDETTMRAVGLAKGIEGTTTTTVPSGGGTVNLTPGTSDQYQIYTGTVTLASNYTIQGAGSPADMDIFYVDWRSTCTIGGNSLTVFGETITATEALNGFYAVAVYDSTAAQYRTTIIPHTTNIVSTDLGSGVVATSAVAASAITTAKLAASAITTKKINGLAITTSKLAASAVTVEKLETDAKTELITIPLSFETSEVGDMKFTFPYPARVNRIDYYVTKDIAATDDASVTAKNNGGLTMGTTTLAASTAIGTGVSETGISTNNTFTANQIMTLTTAKTTKGGKALASVHVTRV